MKPLSQMTEFAKVLNVTKYVAFKAANKMQEMADYFAGEFECQMSIFLNRENDTFKAMAIINHEDRVACIGNDPMEALKKLDEKLTYEILY